MLELFGIFIFLLFSILFSMCFCFSNKKQKAQFDNSQNSNIEILKIKHGLIKQSIIFIYIIQLILLFPIAISFQKLNYFAFLECFIFLFILALSFIYLIKSNWKKGM